MRCTLWRLSFPAYCAAAPCGEKMQSVQKPLTPLVETFVNGRCMRIRRKAWDIEAICIACA
eukprot:JP438199.1.p3 GENE.JP438199.1~~JP438199.1.p3  ORF type:complete len:61 (-),score=5.54 JP438199.1:276-458(-)